MLSYLELRNFKSFSDIKFDLRKAYGAPKKIAFIYGENGSGKSNLISSLLFLRQSLQTLEERDKFKDPFKSGIHEISDRQLLQNILRMHFPVLSDLAAGYKMIGSKQPMSLKFGFRINGEDGSYYMEFSENAIIKEELRYQINKREGVVFSLDKDQTVLSPTVFCDAGYKKELLENIEKYWGKHTFMAVLFNETQSKNHEYIRSRLNENILNVIDWLKKFSVYCMQYKGETAMLSLPLKFMRQLEKGSVDNQNNKELKLLESVLNLFFTQLYSDVKAVYYVFTPEENGFSYELYFKKLIDGSQADIPFSLESTGTRKLLEILPMLLVSSVGASVFIDEIDSGIHDLLMKSLVENLNDSLKGQFIATTHNTLLMESLSPENTYVIRIDASGNKSIDCVAEFKKRTQKTNSIRSKYLRGDYDGIPYTGYFDFQELVEEARENSRASSVDWDRDEE